MSCRCLKTHSEGRVPAMTLVETLVVMAILACMMGMVMTAGTQARTMFDSTDAFSSLQSQSRIALTRIGYDLRMAHNVSVAGNQITYQLPQEWVRKQCMIANNCSVWDEDNLWSNEEVRIYESGGVLKKSVNGTVTNIFAQEIKTLSFGATQYGDEFLITITLARTAANGRAYVVNSTSVINVRN